MFKPFKVPASLQKQLPFKTKPKDWIEQSKKTSVLHKRAVVREPREKEVIFHGLHGDFFEKIINYYLLLDLVADTSYTCRL